MKEVRYTDTRVDEQARELSVKSCPVSMVLESTTGKSFLLNLIDCPGHVNFVDESIAAMRWETVLSPCGGALRFGLTMMMMMTTLRAL